MDVLDLINEYVNVGNYRGLLSKINKNQDLKERVLDLIDNDLSLSEGIYRLLHNLKEAPKCEVCDNKVKYKNLNVGYFSTCSPKCNQQSPSTRDKIKESSLKKFGVDHHTKTEEYRNYLKEKHKNENFGFSSDKFKKYLEENNVSNVSQIQEIKERKIETYKNKSQEEKDDIAERQRKTLQERYGVNNSYELARKFIYHDYLLPSGKIIKLQGYEPFAMSLLLEKYSEDEIIFRRKDVPKIKYSYKGKERTYYPDFYIPKDNLIIEVKSEWTLNVKKDLVMVKINAAKELYDSVIWVCSKDELVEIIT